MTKSDKECREQITFTQEEIDFFEDITLSYSFLYGTSDEQQEIITKIKHLILNNKKG